MECRRWAPTRSLYWLVFFCGFLPSWYRWNGWIDGLGHCPLGTVGMRVSAFLRPSPKPPPNTFIIRLTAEPSPRLRFLPLANQFNQQNCGICDEGSSPDRCQHSEQPESYGQTGLRPRSEREVNPPAYKYQWMLILYRIAKLSPDSLARLVVAVGASEEACKAGACTAGSPATAPLEADPLAARSMLPTFVSPFRYKLHLGRKC